MDENRELGWNDTITKDSEEFPILPPGDYSFQVDHYERARHTGVNADGNPSKIPACAKAIVHFNVYGNNGETVSMRQEYLLWSTLQFKLSELFRSVGLKKEGEPLQMNWDALPGLRGRCKIIQVQGKKDPTRTFNQIDKLYPADVATGGGYTAGKF